MKLLYKDPQNYHFDPRQAGSSDSTRELSRYLPGHLAYPPVDDQEEENRFYTGPSITWCTFDPTGNFLLCNMGGEQVPRD